MGLPESRAAFFHQRILKPCAQERSDSFYLRINIGIHVGIFFLRTMGWLLNPTVKPSAPECYKNARRLKTSKVPPAKQRTAEDLLSEPVLCAEAEAVPTAGRDGSSSVASRLKHKCQLPLVILEIWSLGKGSVKGFWGSFQGVAGFLLGY